MADKDEIKFKIDKDIPYSLMARRGTKPRYKWPWAKMETGDSVLIDEVIVKEAQMAVEEHRRKTGKVFINRRFPDGTLRIWRIY